MFSSIILLFPPFTQIRALAEPNLTLSVVNNSRVDLSSLTADEACGNTTRLIYYMDPGEVLSRPFTARDTHSPEGKLLVKHTAVDLAGAEYTGRSMVSAILLGLHGLSFTYDYDLILPAEINAQLRASVRVAMNESSSKKSLGDDEDIFNTHQYQEFLESLSSNHTDNSSIFVPEVCLG